MPALVAPVVVAATGWAAGSTAVAIASNLIVYVGVTAASTLIQMASQPQQQETGTKLHAASGGAVPQSIILGYKETAGSFIYAGSWGAPGKTPNGYYVRVFCMQDMPSTGFLSRAWAADKKVTIDLDHVNYSDDPDTDYPADGSGYSGSGTLMGHPVTTADHDGNHYFWIKVLDGTQTTADAYLREKFGDLDDRPWTASMIGRGRTLMIVTERFTAKEDQSNEVKNVVLALKGMPLYDWRKDSTNGGSGSHRWGDESTYEFSDNPIVGAYNVMRGIYHNDIWVYGGKNWPARRFDTDTWTAAANACDGDIDLAGGGTEKRATMGAEINLTDQPLSVLDRIFATCGARLVESGGIYKIYVGGIGASVYSFSDDDIILTEALTGKMFPAREDICNTITGTYCEPSNGGQMKAFRKRTKLSYVTEDGGETRSKDVTYDYIRSNTQAQRQAMHALNDNRRFGSKLVALPPSARKLEPGDTMNWSDSDRFGYSNKKWIAGDVTMTRSGVVFVAMREADSTDADWSVSDEEPYTVGIYGDIRPDTQIIDITVTGIDIPNADGSGRKPALKITWPTDADMVDCKYVHYQVRRHGDTELVKNNHVRFADGKAIISGGLHYNLDYDVRAIIIPWSDRDTDFCDWQEVVAWEGPLRRVRISADGRKLVDKSGALNWTGNTVGTTYAETVLVPGSYVTVKNADHVPVGIDLELGIDVRIAVSDAMDRKTFARCRLLFEAQPPGGSWNTIRSVHLNAERNGKKPIRSRSVSEEFSFIKPVSRKDAGAWHFRARLIVHHRNGASGVLTDLDVKATCLATLRWSG